MTVIDQPVNTPDAWSARAGIADTWEACGWSHAGQLERHSAVVAALDPRAGDRLLDWGCGTGDLCRLLSDDVVYEGYDWADGMVRRASREHPGRTFRGWYGGGRYDLVACVGCFNLPQGWSKQHTYHTIRNLWDETGCRTIAVSLYCGDDPNCLSYTGAEAAQLGAQLGYWATVDQIRANDLLLVVHRNEP